MKVQHFRVKKKVNKKKIQGLCVLNGFRSIYFATKTIYRKITEKLHFISLLLGAFSIYNFYNNTYNLYFIGSKCYHL